MKYRGSEAPPHRLICDPVDIDDLEARNGLLQFDEVRRSAGVAFAASSWRLSVDTALSLHEFATRDIYSDAGYVRDGGVTITGTQHQPPPANEIDGHLDHMVSYVNDNWDAATAVHLCSFLMWRCNWVHPFFDGNGRTTRAISYLVFLVRLGFEPGGTPTFVDMIASDKQPYYLALDAADAAWKQGTVDVSSMEALCTGLLAKQLVGVVEQASKG